MYRRFMELADERHISISCFCYTLTQPQTRLRRKQKYLFFLANATIYEQVLSIALRHGLSRFFRLTAAE